MAAASLEFRGPGGVLPIRQDDEAARDLLMLIEGETSGQPLSTVLRAFGRSRSNYYDKLRRYGMQGLAGLFRQSPGPKRPWVRTVKMMQAVVKARILDPTKSAATITAELSRAGLPVSMRSVQRVLTQFSLSAERAERWQGDR